MTSKGRDTLVEKIQQLNYSNNDLRPASQMDHHDHKLDNFEYDGPSSNGHLNIEESQKQFLNEDNDEESDHPYQKPGITG